MVDEEYLKNNEQNIENSNNYISYLSGKHIIKEEDLNKEELVTLIKRVKSKGDLAFSIFAIIIGIPLSIFVFGIFLVVFGAMNVTRWNHNNLIQNECAAYSPSRKEIILFESHNVIYGFDPRDIKYISHDGNDNIARAVIKFGEREKSYYLGKSTYEDVQACNFEIGRLQKQLNEEEIEKEAQ